MKVLLLEDDATLSKEITSFLNAKGLDCSHVYDGELFLKQSKRESYDAFLLDINVPRINGLEVCRTIREVDKSTPILMLTAFGEIDDKVEAFDFGADDYLVKPFHLEELYIRIQALLRRKNSPQQSSTIIEIDNLKIYVEDKIVKRNEEEVILTPKEFKLLLILANAKGRILSKQQIADDLWDYHIETNQNTIEVYINFLRNKIDKNHPIKLIHTKIGYGYFLKAE
ncbi:DNA-binding response regulator, OmpR family, contains REC and winged-helix (wHTH) domain [Spirosomataceae bacterium TFI 002]|nr:DNA-binding response regulator, OmpR family, contains REC and winged-helix (wHTH) domain [Spirosomataceae bacterium TFI 002]